jgi:hypothetical protein
MKLNAAVHNGLLCLTETLYYETKWGFASRKHSQCNSVIVTLCSHPLGGGYQHSHVHGRMTYIPVISKSYLRYISGYFKVLFRVYFEPQVQMAKRLSGQVETERNTYLLFCGKDDNGHIQAGLPVPCNMRTCICSNVNPRP